MDEKNMELITICKQAVMKMESAMTDINEIRESEILTEEERNVFSQMIEMNGNMLAVIVNLVAEKSGISEEDFMSEQIAPEEISEYPDVNKSEDILNEPIE